MKAKEILLKTTTNEELVENFSKAAERHCLNTMINPLVDKIEKLKEDIFQKTQMSLVSDLNKGIKAVTLVECQSNFEDLIEMKFRLKTLELELQVKREAFNEYFGSTNEKYSISD